MRKFIAALILTLFAGYGFGAEPDACTDPAYVAAYKKVAETKSGGRPYYSALVVFVGQRESSDLDGYWTVVAVEVESFPGVSAPGVVVGVPDGRGGLTRAFDLPGKPEGAAIYHAWLHYAYPHPMPAKAARPTVTAYTASWCGPCQSYHRDVLDRPEVKAACDVVFVDASNGFPAGVSSVPTVTMPGRRPLVGYRPLQEFLAWVRGQ